MEIPRDIEERVLTMVKSGRYSSCDEVLARAMAALQGQEAVDERLEALLLEGLEGEDEEVTPEEFDELRARIRRQAGSHAKA